MDLVDCTRFTMNLFHPRLRDVLPKYIARCIFVRHALSRTCRGFRSQFHNKQFLLLMRYLSKAQLHVGIQVDTKLLLQVLFPSLMIDDLKKNLVWTNDHWVHVRFEKVALQAFHYEPTPFDMRLFGFESNLYIQYHTLLSSLAPQRVEFECCPGWGRQMTYLASSAPFMLDSDKLVLRICSAFGCDCTSVGDVHYESMCWKVLRPDDSTSFVVSFGEKTSGSKK